MTTTAAWRVLLGKELRSEARGRDVLGPLVTVAFLVALIGNIALSGSVAQARLERGLAIAAVTWTAITFAAQTGLARSFVLDHERGTLATWLTSPASAGAIFAAKAITHILIVTIVAATVLLAAALFFQAPMHAFLSRAATGAPLIVAGIIGISIVTTLSAAMAMHGRQWVLLVPLLSLPALFPLVAVCVPGLGLVLDGAPLVAVWAHLRTALAYDIVVIAASWVLAPFLIEP